MKKECFVITGGKKLYGEIKNQTSKNATLPIMSACVLCKQTVTITDYPKISDVSNMVKLLKKLGAEVSQTEKEISINAKQIKKTYVDERLSKTMRSSLFLLGPILSRCKKTVLTYPGGCDIGKRPIDVHISAFKRLGVKVTYWEDKVVFDATNAHSAKIKLKKPSVGATENIIQFCCCLKGKTTIYNSAKEPEIVDLCNFLNFMGAKILGAGTNKITIFGVNSLHGVVYRPIGDRITAGTLACAVALCGGELTITNAVPYQNLKLIKILCSMGCQIDIKNDIMHIVQNNKLTAIKKISTGVYPNFPTDLQSILLTLCCVANGETTIKENLFENRFLTVSELREMGANIKMQNNKKACINGVSCLNSATVQAKELRGGAGLVLAGLIANGTTTVQNIHFIDRGYESLEKTLSSIGAEIKRE